MHIQSCSKPKKQCRFLRHTVKAILDGRHALLTDKVMFKSYTTRPRGLRLSMFKVQD